MAEPVSVTRIADGAYRVEHHGRSDIVYVAGSTRDQWAFWNGHLFHRLGDGQTGAGAVSRRAAVAHALTAPMPATVVKVLVTAGSPVKKGDTVIVLEAMKMELPIRAPADATVAAVHCREGELVQPDTPLIEFA